MRSGERENNVFVQQYNINLWVFGMLLTAKQVLWIR
jgi:hypothetical protein